MMMKFEELPEFSRERRRLSRKYKSLSEDIKEFRKVVSAVPFGTGKHFVVIAQTGGVFILKARLFSRYLKGSSLRIVYSYTPDKNMIEFIEIYFKGAKENEDHGRIKRYTKGK